MNNGALDKDGADVYPSINSSHHENHTDAIGPQPIRAHKHCHDNTINQLRGDLVQCVFHSLPSPLSVKNTRGQIGDHKA